MDKTILVTNGCSWVYGDKLKNPKQDNHAATLAKNTEIRKMIKIMKYRKIIRKQV